MHLFFTTHPSISLHNTSISRPQSQFHTSSLNSKPRLVLYRLGSPLAHHADSDYTPPSTHQPSSPSQLLFEPRMPPRRHTTLPASNRGAPSRGRGGGRVGSASGRQSNPATTPRIRTRGVKRQRQRSDSEKAESSDSDSPDDEEDFQPSHHSDSDEDSDEDSDKDQEDPPNQARPIQAHAPAIRQHSQATPAATSSRSSTTKHKIDLDNYHLVGLELGQAQADELLAQQPNNNNTPSGAGLFEAQALQAQYLLDQTMLCVYLGLPLQTLKRHLYVSTTLFLNLPAHRLI